MSYNLVDPTTGDLTRVAGNSNIVDTSIGIDSTWSSKKINDSLVNIADKLEKNVKFDVDDLNTAYVPNKTITVRTNKNTKNLPPSSMVNFLVTSFAYVEGQYYRITQYCYENSENLSCSMYVRRGVSNVGESSITWSAWRELATSADLADKQDFRIFNSLEEFNEKKGTSLTVVSGVDNMKDIANAMSNGEILIIITKYELGSDVYFGLTTDTGWTKMFTFVKSNGLCDVECRTTFPLTFKRVLNSDGVIGDWQQLVTNDDIFLVGDRRNTIGWADLSKDVNINGSSNYANNVGRVEGHNAIIKVSNPTIGYQWPVTNSGDNNAFMDFGGAIQFFTDKVNNHLYVRFADSVDMSAWGEIATMNKVNASLGELCNKKIYCGEVTGTIVNGYLTTSNPIGKVGNVIATIKYAKEGNPYGYSVTAQATLVELNFYFRWHRESDGADVYPPDGTEITISYMIFY